jgi:hypothetical protein
MSDEPKLPIPDCYWVQPGRFLAGEYPGRHDPETTLRRIQAFLDAGLDFFIDLTHAGELPPYESILRAAGQQRGRMVTYARLSIVDHSVPTPGLMNSIQDQIDAALGANRNVYVHCWGGVGRTGTTVACHLIRRGLSGPQALERLAQWWARVPKRSSFPRSPETDEQVQFVLDWRAGQ